MDANGAKYHLLLGYDDWARGEDQQHRANRSLSAPLYWDNERDELTLAPRLSFYVSSARDLPVEPEDRRGAARDRYGNWYWIDVSQQKIRVFSAGSGLVTDFWPVSDVSCQTTATGPFSPETPISTSTTLTFGGLAVTEDYYLVVGMSDPKGLLVFDLYGGGPPTQLNWPSTIDFAPFDMASRPGGGVWILDRTHKRYWALDRHFNVLSDGQTLQPSTDHPQTEAFQPVEGTPPQRPQSSFPMGIPLAALHDPISIEALPDLTVLILDRPDSAFSEIARYRFGDLLGPPISTRAKIADNEQDPWDSFTLVAHDFAFVPAHTAADGSTLDDRLYIVSSNGNQTFAFKIEGNDARLQLSLLPHEYLPMRLFSGKALVADGDQRYYDMGERWLPLIKQSRPRYETDATFCREFDSKLPGCIWHRLMLDACIPLDTQVLIWSRAADEQKGLHLATWQLERFYLRGDGSELPFGRNPFKPSTARLSDETGRMPTAAARSAAAGSGTWELLFQHATGRYLQIRVSLCGQEQRTPRLHAMRIYYPRFSYLEHYLPAVYRADADSASFLERYLANPEGIYTAIEDKIANVRQLFDVDSAPSETLDWLANWFGVALDPGWDEHRRRLFIRKAMLFFQYRGTVRGLEMALRLSLDDCPGEHTFTEIFSGNARPGTVRIIESFLTRKFPAVLFGDPTDLVRVDSDPSQGALWRPADGRAELNYRYQQTRDGSASYPVRDPGGDQSSDWRTFSQQQLGFIPSATSADWMLWQAYLLHTYGAINQYNLAYHQHWDSFDDISLPDSLPADDLPLRDWYRFETVFLPTVRNAHQFSVLLPMPSGSGPGMLEYQRRLEMAKKVIDLEKPAHTTYNIKFFWAMFRVDEARLGMDTLLGQGSRTAEWLQPMVLGQGYLAQGYLADHRPQGLTDRILIGRGCRPTISSIRSAASEEGGLQHRPTFSSCTGCL